MPRQALAVALGVALLAGMGGQADAAKKKAGMNTIITLRGCTHFRPPICTIINSGGHSYDLVGGVVPLNTHMTVRGEMSPMIGFCTVPVVRVLSVKADKMRCPM